MRTEPPPGAKRKPGRPPGTPQPYNRPRPKAYVEEEGFNQQTERAFTLPRPPGAEGTWMTKVSDSSVFFEWWQSLSFPPDEGRSKLVPPKGLDWAKPPEGDPQTSPRYKCYVYRTRPICDNGLAKEKAFGYILVTTRWPFWKIDGAPEFNWRKGIFEAWGSGIYRFEFIDTLAQRSIGYHEVHLEDWSNYPPKLNLSTLLVDHKDNQTWIQHMRARGILVPGDKGYGTQTEESEESMAGATSAVEALVKIAERAMDEKRDGPVETKEEKGFMMEIVRDAISNKGSAFDPMAMMTAVSSMVTQVTQKHGEEGQYIMDRMKALQQATQERILSMQQEALQREQRLMDEIRGKEALLREKDSKITELQMTIVELKNKPPEDLFVQIERVNSLKAALGTGRVVSRRVEVKDEEEEMPSWMKALLPLAVPILQQMAGGMTGQAPVQAPTQSKPLTPTTQPRETGYGQPQSPQQVVPPQPLPIASEDGIKLLGEEAVNLFNVQYAMFLNMVKEPLIRHMMDPDGEGLNGDTFADALVGYQGMAVYVQVQSLGVETLTGAIFSYAPIWDKVKGKHTHESLKAFVGEFVTAYVEEEKAGEKKEEVKPLTQ